MGRFIGNTEPPPDDAELPEVREYYEQQLERNKLYRLIMDVALGFAFLAIGLLAYNTRARLENVADALDMHVEAVQIQQAKINELAEDQENSVDAKLRAKMQHLSELFEQAADKLAE